jgi:hypothetical protein
VSAPNVLAAINAISAEFAQHGIAKTHSNQADDYKYRSIDDLLERLAPLLAKHRLCVFPQALERREVERKGEANSPLFHVSLKVAFRLTSVDDGSSQTVRAFGEAMDASDKATAKAMSAAYKSAMIQTFCIPLCGSEDPDQSSPRASARSHVAEPVQGWQQWAHDIEDIVGLCETDEAISLVQERNRDLLKALSRERADLYQQVGEAFGARREALLAQAAVTRQSRRARSKSAPSQRRASKQREKEDA